MSDDATLKVSELDAGLIYRLFSGAIAPRPIAWVSTLSGPIRPKPVVGFCKAWNDTTWSPGWFLWGLNLD